MLGNATTKQNDGTGAFSGRPGLGMLSSASRPSKDEIFAKELAAAINAVLADDYEREINVLEKLELISSQEAEAARRHDPLSQEYLEKASAWERLSFLVQAGAVNGVLYCKALEYLRANGQLLPDLRHLNLHALELEKLVWDAKISIQTAKALLANYSKGHMKELEQVLDRYKHDTVGEAEKMCQEGLLTLEEAASFKNCLLRHDITVLGMPREMNGESEMAWGILYPLLQRIENWRMLSELQMAGILNADQKAEAWRMLAHENALPQSVQSMMQSLKRLHFARFKNLIKDAEEYQRAVKAMIPSIGQVEGEINPSLPTDIEGELAAEAMEETHVMRANDPLFEHKRALRILIKAWEEVLGCILEQGFSSLLTSSEVTKVQEAHDFLVRLNEKFAHDRRTAAIKKDSYLAEIQAFLADNALAKSV